MRVELERMVAPRPVVQRATPFPLLSVDDDGVAYPHGNQIWIIKQQDHQVIASHVYRITALRCQQERFISADERGNVHINQGGKTLHEFATGMLIRDLVLIPDSPFLFLAGEGRECQAALLNLETGACSPLAGHAKRINQVCLGHGFILTASDDLTIGVYRLVSKKGVEFVRTLKGLHTRFIQAVCPISNDLFASAASDGFIKVFSLEQGCCASWQHQGGAAIMALAWNAKDEQLLSVGTDGHAIAWTADGDQVHEYLKGSSQLLAITPNGICVNLEGDVINVKEGGRLLSAGPKGAIKTLMAPYIALTLDGEAYDWQLAKRVPVPSPRWTLQDGKVYDQAGKELSLSTAAYSIAFDDDRLAVGLDKAICLLPKNESFQVGLGHITALALQADLLAWADDQRRVRILILDDQQQEMSVRWCHHASRVTCLAWQPNAELLASASLDGHLAILDPGNKPLAPLLQIPAGQGTLHSIQWLDPLHLITAGQDGSIRFWRLILDQ